MFFVEEILALTRAVVPARDHNFGKFRAKHMRRIIQNERNLGKADRTALGCAAEDHVLHLRAAQRPRGLLPQNPPDGIRNIRFSRAVRTDDRRNTTEKFDLGAIRERLEAL